MPVPLPLGTDRDAIIQSVVAEYEIVARPPPMHTDDVEEMLPENGILARDGPTLARGIRDAVTKRE